MSPRTQRAPGPAREGDSEAAELLRAFHACAVVRWPDQARRKAEKAAYHKGYEVRFVMPDAAAAVRIRRLLRAIGLSPGAPYRKRSQVVQPVYGRAAIEWFVQAQDESPR